MECCKKKELIDEVGIMICINCGRMHLHETKLVPERGHYQYSNKTVYKSNEYMRDKLLAFACLKPCYFQGYKECVEALKHNPEIEHIREFANDKDVRKVRDIMKKNGMSKFYPFIYGIINDVFRIKLITISRYDIDILARKWERLHHSIIKAYPDKHNLISYNLLLYVILKKQGNAGYKFIMLPNNTHKYLNIVEALVYQKNI